MTDRARPGLVAFYDIWPRNGAGLFLQPWNPHGATRGRYQQNFTRLKSIVPNVEIKIKTERELTRNTAGEFAGIFGNKAVAEAILQGTEDYDRPTIFHCSIHTHRHKHRDTAISNVPALVPAYVIPFQVPRLT